MRQELVPERELCQRMAELNICQDGAELWWVKGTWDDGVFLSPGYGLSDTLEIKCNIPLDPIIAPTLYRMLGELPQLYSVTRLALGYCVQNPRNEIVATEQNSPNAVAKALIALAEQKGGKR